MDFICVGNGQVQYKFLLEQSYLKLFFTLSLTFSFTPPSSSCERRVGGFFFFFEHAIPTIVEVYFVGVIIGI